MTRSAVLELLAASILAVPPASAQTVDEVIARHLAARGGIDNIKAVQSMKITGRMTVGQGVEVPVTLEQKRPASVRLDITFQGHVGTQAFDGTTGWGTSPMVANAMPEPMSADDLAEMQLQADMDGPLVDSKAKGHKVELLSKKYVEGGEAYPLKLTLKSGEVRYVYIDGATYLERKTEARRVIDGKEVETETLNDDYRKVGALLFPFLVRQGVKGQPQKQTITFDTIELNVPLDDARFKMPQPTRP